jgi:membrane protease YdiL (CAAX protease family)
MFAVTAASLPVLIAMNSLWTHVVPRPSHVLHHQQKQFNLGLAIYIASIWGAAAISLFQLPEYLRWGTFFGIDELFQLVCSALMVGFMEELVYRVVAMDLLLVMKLHPMLVLFLSSLGFVWGHPMHGGWIGFALWYVVPSFFAGLYYLKTRNYYALASVHALADLSIFMIPGVSAIPGHSLTGLMMISQNYFGVIFICGLVVQQFWIRLYPDTNRLAFCKQLRRRC